MSEIQKKNTSVVCPAPQEPKSTVAEQVENAKSSRKGSQNDQEAPIETMKGSSKGSQKDREAAIENPKSAGKVSRKSQETELITYKYERQHRHVDGGDGWIWNRLLGVFGLVSHDVVRWRNDRLSVSEYTVRFNVVPHLWLF